MKEGNPEMKVGKVGGPFFLVVLVVVGVFFFAMLRPFLIAILLAGMLAGLLYPLYTRLKLRLWNKEALSSVICVLLVLFLIIIPLVSVMGLITYQAFQVKDSVEQGYQKVVEKGPGWIENFRDHPLVGKIVGQDIDWKQKAGEGAKFVSTFIIKAIGKTSQSTFQTILMSFIMLYTLFFFLIDGPALMQRIKYLSPIKDEYEDQIIDRFLSIARATIKGTIIIGLIQGVMGGITFAIFGVGSSIFWGTLMVILSIIPGVGSALIWVPAIIIKVMTGHIGQGIGILIGGILISVSDNVLRPKLVGKDTKMHELMILFSTLGGIALFGIIGFILGPILAAVFVTVTDIYASEYQEELEA